MTVGVNVDVVDVQVSILVPFTQVYIKLFVRFVRQCQQVVAMGTKHLYLDLHFGSFIVGLLFYQVHQHLDCIVVGAD